jgi:hypothetical protein
MFSIEDHDGYSFWFPHLTSLTTLAVHGYNIESGLSSWRTAHPLEKLQNLYLDNMDLEPDSGRLDGWLELAPLEKLTVRGCQNMGSFLKDLAISYAYHPGQSLKELSVMTDFHEQWVSELDPLLKLVTGIEHLYVSTAGGECIRDHPVSRHGTSLRSLLVDPLNDIRDERHEEDGNHLYSVGDLDSLVIKCRTSKR